MDDFGLLVGRYHSTLPTLADQQLSEAVLDDKGRLIISGRWLAGTDSWAEGNAGVGALAVRKDADGPLAGVADGEYTPLIVDESGRLRVVADLDVDFDFVHAEDSAHTSGDLGSFSLAIRVDDLTADNSALIAGANGDYMGTFVNAKGELYVKDTDALTKLTEIDTVLDSIKVDTGAMVVDLAAIEVEQLAQGVTLDAILSDTNAMVIDLAAIEIEQLAQGVTLDAILSDTNAMVIDLAAIETELVDQGTTLDSILSDTNAMVVDLAAIEAELLAQGLTLDSIDTNISDLTKTEDAAHSSGDKGIMPLAVRNDAGTSLVDTDGDYTPFSTDANGSLRVSSTPIGTEQYTVTDALAAAGDGLETITAAATPWVTVATFSHTSGIAYLYGYQWACDQNAQMRIISDDTSDIVVYKTDINSSAQPGTSEQFSDGGRIEIAGAASLDIKLQIKKRHTSGGNANGTGSLHLRK